MFKERGHEPRMTERAEETDEDRLTGIYERHAAEVGAYILRRSADSDAADAVAETFLVAWRRLDAVPEEPETLPWLYGVARRVLANQRRGNRRRTQLGDRLTTLFVQHDVGPPSLDELEDYDQVVGALRELSDDDAELLRLTAWESLTPSEIATSLGISPAAARKRLHRARKRLRDQLKVSGADVDIIRATRPLPSCGEQPNLDAKTSNHFYTATKEVAWQ